MPARKRVRWTFAEAVQRGYGEGQYRVAYDVIRSLATQGVGPVRLLEAVAAVMEEHDQEAFGDVTEEGQALVGLMVGLLQGAHQRAIQVAAVYARGQARVERKVRKGGKHGQAQE